MKKTEIISTLHVHPANTKRRHENEQAEYITVHLHNLLLPHSVTVCYC